MEILERDYAGEQGEDPGEADYIEIYCQFVEQLVQIVDVDLEVVSDLTDMLIALLEP